MNLIEKFKNALGFGPQDDDYMEEEGIDATVTPLRERTQRTASPEPSPLTAPMAVSSQQETPVPAAPSPASPETDDAIQATVIFDRVLEIFNGSLPDFLQNSVDPAKERQLLFEALDSSTKEYFNQLERNVERRLQARFENDRYRLQEQIDSMKQKALKDEEDTSVAKNLQLSAERQKRALSERVHDLEKQLAALEAENEQYILENKTMANRLRLAAVNESGEGESAADSEALKETAEQLEAEKGKLAAERETILAAKNELEKGLQELEALKENLESERAAIESDRAAVDADRASVNANRDAVEADRSMLESDRSTLEADRAAIVAAQAEIEKSRAEVEKSKSEAEMSKAEAEKLKAEAVMSKAEVEKTKAEAAAANAELAKYKASIEQARVKDELSQAMVNDLNSKAMDARKALAAKERECEELSLRVAELSSKKNRSDAKVVEIAEQNTELENKLTDLTAKISGLTSQLTDTNNLVAEKDNLLTEIRAELATVREQLHVTESRLGEAQENLKIVREVEQQVTELENAARATDAKLRATSDELLEKNELLKIKDADLINKNTSLMFKDETIKRLEDQTDSLRKTIENLTFEKEQTEAALRQEIERLKMLKAPASQPVNELFNLSGADAVPNFPTDSTSLTEGAAVAQTPQTPAVPASAGSFSEEPKLEKLPIDAPSSASDSLPELTLDFSNSRKPSPDKPKRRRGRPPKAVIPDEPTDDFTNADTAVLPSVAAADTVVEKSNESAADTAVADTNDFPSIFDDAELSVVTKSATIEDKVTAKEDSVKEDSAKDDSVKADSAKDDSVKADKKDKDSEYEDLGLLDSTDWLISEPEPERPAKRQHKSSKAAQEDDFGYKEVPRQSPPDSPAQMLLW